MKNLEKAKERAENYLYRIIEQKWDSFVKNGIPVLIKWVGRPPRTVRIKMKPIDYFELMNWPLRFEAYSYLGNKYIKKIRNFNTELKKLWNEWIELSKKGLFGSKEIFWSTENEALNTINLDRKKTRFPGNEIESHISMFRAKEILGIVGYEPYFNEAKKRIRDALTSKPHLFLNRLVIQSLESFVRSPLLKSKISDYLRAVARKLSEDEEPILIFSTSHDQAKIAFLLCFGNFGSDLFDSAKRVMMELIDKQAKNGSFENNLNTTCLCASAIHYMKLDPLNSICSEAIDYILKEQNKEGYWDFFSDRFSKIGYGRYSTDWNVLSTVIVLETLDLITNDKPLPVWVPEENHYFQDRDKQPSRVHTIIPFPIPQDAFWGDVYIRFLDCEKVEIRVLEKSYGVNNFAVLEFENKRTHIPIKIWETLYTLAKVKGVLEMTDDILSEKERDTLEKNISLLRKKLKKLFGTAVDPFQPYKKSNWYETKFNISVIREEIDDKRFKNDEIKEVYNFEIEKKEIQQASKITLKRLEEIKGKKEDSN